MKNKVAGLQHFFRSGQSTGLLLLASALLSLVLANTGVIHNYSTLWDAHLMLAEWLPSSPRHIINEGLMAIFFFVAGLEIRHELSDGQLNTTKKAMMPVIAATGGMLMPALLYFVFCSSPQNANGWGIPMATDIAFSLAVLSLAGNKATNSMRIFLTSIAVIDDVGGIITIAVFYPAHISAFFLFCSLALTFLLFIVMHTGKGSLKLFLAAGALLWFFMYNSGISPAIAGVITAWLVPAGQRLHLVKKLQSTVNFFILPLFALANTALVLPADAVGLFTNPVMPGVIAGLVVGKPLGIYLFTKIGLKQNLGELPQGLTSRQLLAVGMVAGIGFTVSLFMAPLAFQQPGNPQLQAARFAILIGSLLSGCAGYLFIKYGLKALPQSPIKKGKR
jgi:NhaA family Na+:H+ antiporter